ncbi:MAG: hypothetical protein JO312_23180 [Hyphomicrobiales bacterium]|nr:hypothetical protein [Hyphomicrobiales bacterium]
MTSACGLRQKRDRESHRIPEWEELRALASSIKEHTLVHLDEYGRAGGNCGRVDENPQPLEVFQSLRRLFLQLLMEIIHYDSVVCGHRKFNLSRMKDIIGS